MQYILSQEELNGFRADSNESKKKAYRLAELLAKVQSYPCTRNEYCTGCEIDKDCPMLHHCQKP